MPSGLTIYNSANTIQVDENYRNLAFRERRAISLSHSVGTAYHDIVVTGANVVVGMQSAHYAPYLLSVAFDGTNWTYRWAFFYLAGGEPTSDTAYLYIFDDPPANTDLFGLEVFDASGDLVYHSNVQALKIVDVLGGASTFTGTPGRVYVPIVLQASIRAELTGTYFNVTDALRANGHVISPVAVTMGAGFVGYFSGGVYAAVDVTGYS